MFDFGNFLVTIARLLNYSLGIYFWVVIASVIVSWIPLDPYHPTAGAILRFLRRATEPTFNLFRRTFHLHRYTAPFDVTPILVILAISFLRIFLVGTIVAIAINNINYVMLNFLFAILYTLSSILNIYFWIVIIAVIVSWIPLDPYHPIARAILAFLRNATEPVFSFLRRTLHLHRYTSPLDFTPIIVILTIFLIQNFILSPLMRMLANPSLFLFFR
jgi:YggT family protein